MNSLDVRRRRNRRRALRVAALTVLGSAPVLALAAPAYAATGVAKVGTTLVVDAAVNKANVITVSQALGNFLVRDAGDTLTAGAGCVQVIPNLVRCPTAGIARIAINSGDLNDRVSNFTATPSTLNGGTGSDVLSGGSGNDTLIGGFGNDTLFGNAGRDTAVALAVRDGADRFSGGAGIDTTTYAARTIAVNVSLNGVANDGSFPEFDNNLADVENAVGGSAGDLITGNASANTLQGLAGADRLSGLGGNDVLRGGFGNDTIVGGAGADRMFGEAGNDTLNGIDGVRGNDRLDGGANVDVCAADLFDIKISCEL